MSAGESGVPRVFRGEADRGAQSPRYSPRLDAALSRLEALVDWERRARVAGAQRAMRVDCAPCSALLDVLGQPQRRFRAIHVTGSKGKGSVSAMVTYALSTKAALKTGWYRSPHVERVTERVGIGQVPIEDDVLAASLECALDAKERAISQDSASAAHHATWFDVLCAAGMHALAAAEVDWAVVEVGMGGRRDSTNILHAPYAVLTNVFLEHAEIIGPTRTDIAYEKVGIVHRGTFLVTGVQQDDAEPEVFNTIKNYCAEIGAAGMCVVSEKEQRDAQQARDVDGTPTKAHRSEPRANSMLERNRCMANAVLERMHADGILAERIVVDAQDAHAAMRALPARMESFFLPGSQVRVVIDGAHVPESVDHVISELMEQSIDPRHLVVLLAVGQEKNAKGIVHAATRHGCAALVCTQVGPEATYLPSHALYAQVKSTHDERGAVAEFQVADISNPLQALETALAMATALQSQTPEQMASACVLVVGSLHLAGKVRPMVRAAAGA
ncbi:Dihydrofolate synthase/folylpolyglutamate synthase [Porphyridium purpureum]|uniref:Dihydrofolate synthase/folylpolyglutamate synthase n=1 Tax=Porphyridium purpureum TaxID=35688 RepID=A0A5J4YJD0_PORPP|nr:Dihydrofolate synthase/folylpolyglutamate synthase [Porphyridium purpureum]|eukprot:POR2749..scf291_13